MKLKARKSNKTPVLIESIAISGTDYTLDQALSTCVDGEQLQPKGTCKIVVEFSPSSPTTRDTDRGSLTVTTNAETVKPEGGIVGLSGGGKEPKK